MVFLTLARIVISSPDLLRSSFPAERALNNPCYYSPKRRVHQTHTTHPTLNISKDFFVSSLSLYIEPPDALDGNVLPGWPGRALLCKHRRRGSEYSAALCTRQSTSECIKVHSSCSIMIRFSTPPSCQLAPTPRPLPTSLSQQENFLHCHLFQICHLR